MAEASCPFPDLLAGMARERFSGSVAAVSGEALREVVFTEGEIRAARSNLEEEKLGLWLVDRGRISEGDRALTLLSQGKPNAPPLGHLLVIRGSIGLYELEKELQELALAIISRAASAPDTRCEIREHDSWQHDTLPNTTTPQIILVAARAHSNSEEKQASLGPLTQVAWPAPGISDLLQELSLTPAEAFLLSRLEGTRTLSALISISALPPEQAVATLYALKLAGIISIGPPTTPTTRDRRLQSGAGVRPGGVNEGKLSPQQRDERSRIRRLAAEVSRIDHYQALCVTFDAGTEEITDAWRAIDNRYHPDRVASPHLKDLRNELTAIHERACEAFDVLSRPDRRRRYDRILRGIKDDEGKGGSAARKEVSTEARAELVEANLKRAEEFIRDGELYLAIRLLEQACDIDPRPAELVKLAQLLQRNPLWASRALESLRRATEIEPYHADAWFELSKFWEHRGHTERQRKALERAITADPQHQPSCQAYLELSGQIELRLLIERAHRSLAEREKKKKKGN